MRYLINKRKVILIAICIMLGLVVAYQETTYVRSNEIEYVKVVTLKEDVSVNTILGKGHLEYKDYPQDIVNGEFTQNIDQAVGKYLVRNVKAGTPLFVSDISNKKTVVVPEGMVRVSFATALPEAMAGAINPGSYVNLGFVTKNGDEAKMLFTNIQVARVTDKSGNELNNGNAEKKTNAFATRDNIPATVTVILTPDDSVLLKQHEAKGKIFIMGQ